MISATLWLSLSAASAEPGLAGAPTLEWARPFTLEAPEVYTMTADRPRFTGGLLLQLRVDPTLLVPRQVDQPVLYVGELPVFAFNADPVGGCLVAMLPVTGEPPDLVALPLFFHTELPSRIDRARASALAADALRRGATPPPASAVSAALAAGGSVLQATDLREVQLAAMERVAACTATPSDLQRPGIPAR